jgi:hypothetical protein
MNLADVDQRDRLCDGEGHDCQGRGGVERRNAGAVLLAGANSMFVGDTVFRRQAISVKTRAIYYLVGSGARAVLHR